ncbi:MAG TPA: alpha/beta hydrolase [Actinomycetes bacterium]|nr:alpha/beta hydrolase [Actinomycetes bacterium]
MSTGPFRWPATSVQVGAHQVTLRHAEPTGSGAEPAVFVHGLGGSSLDWTRLMDLLRDLLDAVAPDLPGFGYSPPPQPARYTLSGYSKLIEQLIEQTYPDTSVHLLGNSMGGTISTLVAAHRPELVRTLTLISPALPELRPLRSAVPVGLLAVPGVGLRTARKLHSVPAEQRLRMLLNLCFGDPAAVPADWREAAIAEVRRRSELPYAPAVLVASTRGLIGHYLPRRNGLWKQAARVSAPTLLVYGGRDKLVNPRMASRAVRTYPNARLVVLPNSGHVAQLEYPEAVARAFRQLHVTSRTPIR